MEEIERVIKIGFKGVFGTVGKVTWQKFGRDYAPLTRKGLNELIVDRATDLIRGYGCSGKLDVVGGQKGFSCFCYQHGQIWFTVESFGFIEATICSVLPAED